ncbi:nitrogen fixation protein NifH [Chloroflexota bacterium]
MTWQNEIKEDTLSWLLELDMPGVRYLALRDLCDLPITDKELQNSRKAAHEKGPISAILEEMNKEGYWSEPGPGYRPKYKSTVWSIIMLAQLGASKDEDERIELACTYLMGEALTERGQFTASGTPSGTADCLQGNLCWALLELGYVDPQLDVAYEWMARSVTGEGVAPKEDKKAEVRYYASKCGPNFVCGSNNKLPCAWGAVKEMLAFSRLPADRRTPIIEKAIKQGVDFLFSTDPAKSEYPTGFSDKPSGNWWKFGFPIFYVTDLLQNVEALVGLGYRDDPRLTNAIDIIREKQDEQGRWSLEYSYTGKTWFDFGEKKKQNKWVTLRASRVLKGIA